MGALVFFIPGAGTVSGLVAATGAGSLCYFKKQKEGFKNFSEELAKIIRDLESNVYKIHLKLESTNDKLNVLMGELNAEQGVTMSELRFELFKKSFRNLQKMVEDGKSLTTEYQSMQQF